MTERAKISKPLINAHQETILLEAFDAILPRRCLYCKTILPSGVLCQTCQTLLKRVDTSRDGTEAAYSYAGILRELIVRAKFQPDECTSRLLARHLYSDIQLLPLGDRLRQQQFSAVTYVPSHWLRRMFRKHELSRAIAKSLSRFLAVPMVQLLSCNRFDPPLSKSQSILERKTRLVGRFRVSLPAKEKIHLLLVDDVSTTGTTLEFCSHELEQAGYSVHSFVLARRFLSCTQN